MAETTVLRASSINRTPNLGAKPRTQLSGALPPVMVNMNSGGPQVSGGTPARQGVVLLPPKAGTRNFTIGGLPNQGAKSSVVISAPKDPRFAAAAAAQAAATQVPMQSPLTADQLLYCRHLVDKDLDAQRAASDGTEPSPTAAEIIRIADATIVAIDATLAALTAAEAQAAAEAAAIEAAAAQQSQPPPPRRTIVGGPRQVAAGAAPRRIARPAGPPPPPVIVKMDADRPVQQAISATAAEVTSTPPDAQG